MLLNIALDTIKKHNLISKNDTVIVGVSGGADSVSLLHFLKEISLDFSLNLVAVHINHCIRKEEAKRDMDFVADFCKKLAIPLEIFSFNIPQEAKKLAVSEEEAGRIFRYRAFSQSLEKHKADKIAVAHNQNDNAETLVLNLLRGSGLKGLCAIPYKRDTIVRPLLDCSREAIEKYCKKNGLSYITDSTNNLDIYTRNKVRLNLFPILKEFNSNIVPALAKTANILKEDEEFINNIAKKTLTEIIVKEDKKTMLINIDLLKKYDTALIKRVFRLICLNFNKNLNNISEKHINMLLDLLNKPSGKSVNLPKNLTIKKEYDNFLITNSSAPPASYKYLIPFDQKIYIKEINKFVHLSKIDIDAKKKLKKVYTIMVDYDKIKNTLILRPRLAGDKIFLNRINKHKKIKNLFIDLKIPNHTRNSIPLLIHQDEVVAILGARVSDYFKATKDTNNICYIHFWEE